MENGMNKNSFEIDFLNVASPKSGDAITIKMTVNGVVRIHVVDGGFQLTGEKICDFLETYYGVTDKIDYVVVTHNDGDHAGGLRAVLEKYEVGALYMLRPWVYADELIDGFKRWRIPENLEKELRSAYPNLDALEKIALEKGIEIKEPFQGTSIGEFTVLWPSKDDYFELIYDSDKTPEVHEDAYDGVEAVKVASEAYSKLLDSAQAYISAKWGVELFPKKDTSAENNMSIIQYAKLDGKEILLTGDAGKKALSSAYNYVTERFGSPKITHFQVPHHGSRNNVDTQILDSWLGKVLDAMPGKDETLFSAIVCASKKDKKHPRKTVIRAIIHRGGHIGSTEESNKRFQYNAPKREGWSAYPSMQYPTQCEPLN
ncbi:ComEC/Rec2 family competence protein [Aeromonas dhakensis]|uniref:ComEC/Rec2 family competence protein n=1 Tax=Aeromonas dhakensis TaxID=196024 RepID=UPI003B9FED95